ncbi:MAG: polyprenyl synthetase family protein [Gammaproteobacteria bacterium]|nr:polyprenyl synthetase family protein [Gammaproteobacteria bacterium]
MPMATIAASNLAQNYLNPDLGQNAEHLLTASMSLVTKEMLEVNRTIERRLDSDISLINEMSEYIIKSGGKRLRPLILLLCAKCCGYEGEKHIQLATVIEFIHTATLLHDDVVDDSGTRRGRPSANHVWGNGASILVGDFLYSRAFEIMIETDSMEVMRIMASATNAIAEGEVLQLMNSFSAGTTEDQYMDTIERKTAKLFESAAHIAGVISDQDSEMNQCLAGYGLHLGISFQLIDDILDYIADDVFMGKDLGDDLAEGKLTLPLIHALERVGPKHRQSLCDAIENRDRKRISDILEIVKSTGSIDYTLDKAYAHTESARNYAGQLPQNQYRDALISLAEFSVIRSR